MSDATIPFEIRGHDLRDAATALGCGLTKARELVKNGELESYRIGRRVLVTGRAILAYQLKQAA
jgi:excisionase family DNA binding protein